MIKCSKCGHENQDTNKFCAKCGSPLVLKKRCPSCGAELEKDADFCGNCGKKIEPENLFCTNCGAKLTEGTKFCVKCGTPASGIQPAAC